MHTTVLAYTRAAVTREAEHCPGSPTLFRGRLDCLSVQTAPWLRGLSCECPLCAWCPDACASWGSSLSCLPHCEVASRRKSGEQEDSEPVLCPWQPGHPCGARPAALRGTPLRGPPAGWLTPLPAGCECAARLSCWLHTPRPSDPTGTHVSCDTVTRGRVWSRGSGRRAAQSLCWPCDLRRAVEGSCLAFFSCLRGRIPASLDCSEDHPDNVRKRSGIKRGLVSMNSNSST